MSEIAARFSPDGKWIAYTSRELGRSEVYVAPFPGPGRKWQISSAGGTWPRWRQDGMELYFVSPDQKLMAVEIRADSSFDGVPVPLFSVRSSPWYDVSADGRRFLVITEVLEEQSPLTLVVNWPAGLKR